MLRLTQEIERSGLSRFMVAVRSGLSPRRIEAIEQGGRYHYAEIDRLGQYFGMNGQELLREVETSGKPNCGIQ
jgi:transcriptional regulator with XRE-family HTH domain